MSVYDLVYCIPPFTLLNPCILFTYVLPVRCSVVFAKGVYTLKPEEM